MSEARQLLLDLINHFDINNFNRFFRLKSRHFTPDGSDYRAFDDDDFQQGFKLGEIRFPDADQVLICSFQVQKSLTERSGKKAQYEKAKSILRSVQNQVYNAGIFIFYDPSGNFRFSLIYPQSLGTRRQWSHFRRFTYFVSTELTNKTFLQRVGDGDFSDLSKIKEAFSVERVTKDFYQDIAYWYFWAVSKCEFPKDAESETNGRNIAVIRLITRLIFIWFMRERGLVPKMLFDKKAISAILKNLDPEDSSYYTAILQNLFFATLSTKIEERRFRAEEKYHKGWNPDYDNQYVFRYQEAFHKPETLQDYFGDIPFLNGGLFECLDDKKNGIIIDGFSRTRKNQPYVPNKLFFSPDANADLNDDYGTKNIRYTVRGILNTLSAYNFTIDENEPDDAEVALDPELLGRVFENLLASFNPETASTARKATGSYYTPREIVDYMVTESLKTYFKTHLESIDDLDPKLDKLFSITSDENPFDALQTTKMVELIENVNIVDPAVGSGAFPMGALNKLVFILRKIDPSNHLWKKALIQAADQIADNLLKRITKEKIDEFFKSKNAEYFRKLHLIQRCIYGVDIQQIAVEIAKLRFFIALLVDEVIEKEKPNWGIEPLPNLDFKIMQGNSLLEEFDGIKLFDEQLLADPATVKEEQIKLIKQKLANIQDYTSQLYAGNKLTKEKLKELNEEGNRLRKQLHQLQISDNASEEILKAFDANDEAEKIREALKELHSAFFNASDKNEKDELRQKINETEWNLIAATLSKQNKTEKLADIEALRKSKEKPFFLWKLNFAEVFKNGGFDIVIGNPPYKQLQKDGGKLADELKDKGFETFERTGDIYCIFYEKGVQLLKHGGHLCYITSNKWMRAGYGKSTRAFFLRNNPIKLIDLGSGIFESATVDTNVLLLQKTKSKPQQLSLLALDLSREKDSIALEKFAKQWVVLTTLTAESWTISNPIEQRIKEKIETKGIPLKDWNISIYRGILTGYNEAFIIAGRKRAELIAEDPKSAEIIKPLLRGRDIKRYKAEFADLWLIYVPWHFPLHNQPEIKGASLVAEIEFEKQYPAIYKHLLSHKIELAARNKAETGIRYEWYALQRWAADYYQEFEKEKIIYPNMTLFLPFIYDNKLFYTNQKCFIITKNDNSVSLKYLVGFLNSKVSHRWIKQNCPELQGGTRELSKIFFENIPIPNASPTAQAAISSFVDEIIPLKAINADTTVLEQQIDNLVYRLYDLTYEEVKVIDPEFPLSKAEYEAIEME